LKEWSIIEIQEVVSLRLKILGFIVFDYLHKQTEVTKILTQAWKEGKIIIGDEVETVLESKFEDVPRTWLKLYEGVNTGKMITKMIQ
jgi:NADPH-dependent curcumin reductase CurA